MTGQVHQPEDRAPMPITSGASARFERQKQRILDAATVSLNQRGVWGMTLQDVAGALDLGTSSVTYYFKRREHIAAAVFKAVCRGWPILLGARPASHPSASAWPAMRSYISMRSPLH